MTTRELWLLVVLLIVGSLAVDNWFALLGYSALQAWGIDEEGDHVGLLEPLWVGCFLVVVGLLLCALVAPEKWAIWVLVIYLAVSVTNLATTDAQLTAWDKEEQDRG